MRHDSEELTYELFSQDSSWNDPEIRNTLMSAIHDKPLNNPTAQTVTPIELQRKVQW